MKGEGEQKKAAWHYRVCPNCGRRIHIDRKYCACGADLWATPISVTESQLPPEMYGKTNIDLPDHSCESCGGNCAHCASHGVPLKNGAGFGGPECEHRQDDIKCACCQIFIKNMGGNPGEIDRVISESMREVQRIMGKQGRLEM